MSDTSIDTVRITTTRERANALADAGRLTALDRDLRKTPDPVLHAAVAEIHEALREPERRRLYRRTLKDAGIPSPQRPVRAAGGMHDDYRETHPAYGMIGASRVSGHAALAGSDFLHQNFMTIRIKRADLNRGLSSDRWHGNEEIIEVALSEAQWATFVSATNVGDGVPCTLAYTEQDGHLPGINRREQVSDEIAGATRKAVAAVDELLADPSLTKRARDKAERARKALTDSMPFIIDWADEHMEATIEHAKIEVDAWMTGAIQRAGLQALGAQPPIAMIEPGEEARDD